jgi:short-subunit dehydrogenase
MTTDQRPFAVVTGASTGIGFELARECATNGYDLIVVADEHEIHTAAASLRESGALVEALEADLATVTGVDELERHIGGRPVGALLANAGRGLGRAFLDQDFDDIRHVVDTNVTGTLDLIHREGRRMRERGQGKILITGSIAGFMPGTFHAVYNATKAFLDSFSYALRAELDGSGVTVTCLMPGATETEFFERADLMDTKVGVEEKAPAGDVAKQGFEAMQRGEGEVITGWQNKLRAAMARLMPAETLAKIHAKMTGPGTAAQK